MSQLAATLSFIYISSQVPFKTVHIIDNDALGTLPKLLYLPQKAQGLDPFSGNWRQVSGFSFQVPVGSKLKGSGHSQRQVFGQVCLL